MTFRKKGPGPLLGTIPAGKIEAMKETNDIHRDYLFDLALLVKEYAREAKAELEASRGTDSEIHHSRETIAFSSVITLMQHQAEAFHLPLAELRLEDIEPERDLL